ncbi:unnamed protein product [Phytophthora fragariaefolia]|uniref:RxLR effector protein n=1 Tax=Phytophthora fragariaefolia TaxID=1490495 RepID=A0A9W6YE85_9STRA|nr:unnamed protein product [Phytophthora fragariaefolia]
MMTPPRATGAERQRRAQGKTFLEHQADRLATVRRELQLASDRMSAYYDENRPVQSFAVGEEVLLSTENLANYHAGTTKSKLGARWIGPYRVEQRLGHDYYELKLPKGVKFHPVFHTSYLKPYVRDTSREQEPFKVQLPDGTEGELVDDIVGHKHIRGKDYYEVKWTGKLKTTWEPLANLRFQEDCDIIAALLANVNAFAAVQPVQVTLSKTNPVNASALDHSLASGEHGNSVKRSLRTRDPVDENEDEEEEERRFVKKLKFWLWFKRGENPKTIYKMLGLQGLGQKAYEHKNFQEYLNYAKFWRAQP